MDKAVADWMQLGVWLDGGENDRAWGVYWQDRAETGVRLKKPSSPPPQARDASLRALIRMCAKDSGRPFVSAEAHIDGTDRARPIGLWEINLPNDDRMAPVVSHLLLAAQPITASQKYPPYSGMPPVGVVSSDKSLVDKPSRRVFRIRDLKMFDMWLDRCRTDPIFRKALGTLPTR